jgi:hypothetical protein
MLITVKNVSKREEIFDISIDEKVQVLMDQVRERFGYMNKVKLIYAGKILNHDEQISLYFDETCYGFIVCFQEKTMKLPEIPSIIDNTNTNTNIIDTELRTTNAVLFAFFRFIQSHEGLKYIFFTNPGVMNQMFKEKKFDSLVSQLLDNKKLILDGLENNIHTQIDLTIDESLVNSIMMNLFFNNNN